MESIPCIFDETRVMPPRLRGWAPFVLATESGNGTLDSLDEPGKPAETAGKDMRITGGSGPYASECRIRPTKSISETRSAPGLVGSRASLRFDPETKLSEFYSVPGPGFGIRRRRHRQERRALGFSLKRGGY